jgi:hypothetical protein
MTSIQIVLIVAAGVCLMVMPFTVKFGDTPRTSTVIIFALWLSVPIAAACYLLTLAAGLGR